MNDIGAITKELFGFALPKLECSAGQALRVSHCPMDLEHSRLFENLLKYISGGDFEFKDLDVFQALLQVGVKLSKARLISNDFWWILMKLKYSPKTKVEEKSGVLSYLLRYGLERNNRDSWKHLYVLSEICYSVPRSKLLIADMIRERYASKIGELLSKMDDFQQANLLIELLSNYFPRKSTREVGVVLPPTLWHPGSAMNDQFFNNPLYPFRGKHGDPQVTTFVWNICRGHMENLVRLSNVTYGSSSNGSGGKRLRVNEAGVGPHYSYVQAIHGGIFLWDAEGMFLEMDRRRLSITKSSKGKIKIHVIGDTAKCLNSTSKLWLKMFSTAKWFQLDVSDQRSSDKFFYEITHVRKISEVQTFLTLNHTDEDTTESNEEVTSKTMPNLQYRSEGGALLGSSERQPESGCRIDKADQLATPEHSDAKIGTDEWDFNPSSEQQGTALSNAQGTMQVTPKRSDDLVSNSSHSEESPLVLAQKRRRIRETTKNLEMLKKGFTLTSNPPSSKGVENTNAMRSPSLTITKFESNSKVSEKYQEGEKIKTPKIKAVNSIGVKDISILNTIFGKSEGSSSHKRSKRQQRLKNFKPVIDVPSQDPPVTKKNTQRKERNVVTRSCAKATGKEGLAGQAEVKNNRTGEKGINMPAGGRDNADLVKKMEPSAKKDAENQSRKRTAEQNVDKPPSEHRKKTKRTDAAKIAQPKADGLLSKVENIENPTLNNVSLLDSTTMLENLSYAGQTPLAISSNNSFTNRLNEQIFSSITLFSNEMIRKMAIINKELNHKIVKELSEKYQKLFQELQRSFQSDTEEMLNFMGEIKDMMNLSEDDLTQVIRNREFGQYSRAAE